MTWSSSRAVALVCLLLAVVGFSALDRYNVTWDEALGDLFYGERYFLFWTSLDPSVLAFTEDLAEPRTPDLGLSPFRGRPWEYPPVAATAAAAVSDLLSRRLGWLDAFDGYHALNVFLALLLVAVWLPLLARRLDPTVALAAVGFLFASPRLFAHWMANVKDFPSMVLFTLTVALGLAAVESGRPRAVVAVGVLWGLALGTKFNALFLPGIPALALLGTGLPPAWAGRGRRLLVALAGAVLAGVLTLIAVWPWLWPDPIGRLVRHVGYLAGRRAYTADHSLAPVLDSILGTSPPLLLGFALVGLVPLVARLRRRDPLACWTTAWIVVVLGRYLPPQAVNFDGVRHFLELFPPLAIVAALGFGWLLERLGPRVPVRPAVLRPLALTLALAPGIAAVAATHPFQLAYWNALAGGTSGAWMTGEAQVGDYWGTSYRLGLEWLSREAPPDARLAVPVVEHAVRLVASERLRDDIVLLPLTTPFSPRIDPRRWSALRRLATEEPVWVMFVPRRDWMNQLMLDCLTRLEPVVSWELDGVPVLLIYRWAPPDRPVVSTSPASQP